jgi:hypothetical protein
MQTRNNRRNKKKTRATTAIVNTQRKLTEQDIIDKLMADRIPKTLMRNAPFPPQMIRKLVYNEPELLLQSSTATFLVKEWRMSDVWDPDPALGGGSVAGFNKLIAIYNLWRVENFKIKIQVANNEPARSVTFGLIFRDARPSSIILTAADAQNALEVQPSTGPNIVGETTGNSIYRGPWHKIAPQHVLGNTFTYYGDNDYAGVGSATPSQVLWVAFVAYIGTGDLTNGVFLNAYMEFTTRFYSLIGIQE